jgi:beta-lactam-binding protein with PASTA domain
MSIKQKLLSPIVWGNLLAMVLVTIVLALVVWQGMDSYTHHGESIQVPELKGLQMTDAQYRLEQLGLHAMVVDSSYHKGMAPGCVLDYTPAAGRRVKSGRNIYITINTERTPTVALPDLADNSSLREAQAKLTAMGFRMAPVELVHGDKEWVYGIKSGGRNVYAGERVSIDVPLVLQVGNGKTEEEDESLNDVTIDSYDILDDVLE